MFKLIIEDDEGKTTEVPIIRDEISIGRKEGNAIRLTERNISRHHARLSRHNGSVYIEDLDSYTGIRVNGDRIQGKTPTPVQEGDLIEIGDYHLALQRGDADGAGLAGGGREEPTQRVTLGMLGGGEEVTSQVVMELTPAEPAPRRNDTLPMPAVADDDVIPLGEMTPPPGSLDAAALASTVPDTPHLEAPAPRPESTAVVHKAQVGLQDGSAQPRLVVISTALAGRSFPLAGTELVIGRTPDNAIPLDHRSVSRHHAKVVREGERWAVVDLNSANGVLVNGQEYKKIDLRRADVVELGNVKLRFVDAGEEFSLSAEEIARMSQDDGDDGDFDSKDVTNPRGRTAPRKLPVKLVIGASLGVLVVAIVALALLLGKGKSSTPPSTPVPPETTSGDKGPPPEDGDSASGKGGGKQKPAPDKGKPPTPEKPPEAVVTEASRQITAGKAALRTGDFNRAREAFEKALAVGDENGQAKAGLEQVEKEATARDQLDNALNLRETDLRGAYRALQAIPNGTRARERANAELRALRTRLVQKLVKDGERALADGNPQEARDLAAQAMEVDDSAREAQKLRDKADKALASKGGKSTRPPPPGGAKESAPPPPPGSARTADAKKALEDGNRAILLGNFDEAVAKGKLALKLDASVTDAHKLLGVAFARQGRYCDAKFHYKKYIELNPNSSMIDRIKQILQGPELQNCP